MENVLFKVVALVLMAFVVYSCEKPVIDDDTASNGAGQEQQGSQPSNKTTGNVVLRVSNFNFVPYTSEGSADARVAKTMTDLTTYCTRLNYVIYKDGKKVTSRSQLKEDAGFGETTVKLDAGIYKLLVLAHSSKGGNPTLSDPENIQFTNTLGYSDTFSYYGDLEVTNEVMTHEITLTRVSSLLLFTVTDDLPANVTHMYFYYTGGSGVLNAVTGYGGNVNSKQEKNVNVSGMTSPLAINVYTFLQADEGSLNLKINALDANSNVVASRQFSNIPVKRNVVTEFKGSFFKEESFTFVADTEWSDTLHFTF